MANKGRVYEYDLRRDLVDWQVQNFLPKYMKVFFSPLGSGPKFPPWSGQLLKSLEAVNDATLGTRTWEVLPPPGAGADERVFIDVRVEAPAVLTEWRWRYTDGLGFTNETGWQRRGTPAWYLIGTPLPWSFPAGYQWAAPGSGANAWRWID